MIAAFQVLVPPHEAEAATLELQQAGTLGLEERGGTARLEWLVYFGERPGLLDELRRRLPSCRFEPCPVPEIDWIERFRDGFTAFEVGDFHIVPAWRVAAPPPPDSSTLIVDPGPAFGTGTHASTRLCLRGLERLARTSRLGRVLDLGCGSGILAIAALRLGAAHVVASDLDPIALETARRHAGLNGVVLDLVLADAAAGLRTGVFDVVLANLTAPLLVARRDEIAALGAPGGRLLLAGMLAEELPGLVAAYRERGSVEHDTDDGWGRLSVSLP